MLRRAAVLAAVAVLTLVGQAQAASGMAKVTGTYTYYVNDDPSAWRTVTINARATDPLKGTFTWVRPSGVYSGPVSCLRVAGNDAWFAGPVTSWTGDGSEDFVAAFFWVHDGGNPGKAGDLAFGWATDPWETLADMEALCANMDTEFYGSEPFAVVAGNVTVHPGK
jgi:hypothetical protein